MGMSILVVILVPVLFMVIFFFANRFYHPDFGAIPIENPKTEKAGQTLTVATWNIGYASLGKDADFVVDGGTHFRALKKPQVAAAAEKIAATLAQTHSDIILIQENAGASLMTYGISVRKIITNALPNYASCFWADFMTQLLPKRLKIKNGMSVFAKKAMSGCTIQALPQETGFYYGMFKKYYGAMVQRYPIKNSTKQWVVINIHLAAFDNNANTRSAQITALFELAQTEFALGNYVIIGGDWNLRISTQDFPHKTEKKYLFWIFDFPVEHLPKEWRFATDEKTATVRTLHKPYVAGENYSMIIDGFAVSPNVTIDKVHTSDTKFEYTDHHLVAAQFSCLNTDI